MLTKRYPFIMMMVGLMLSVYGLSAHAATIEAAGIPSGVLDDTDANETDWALSVDAFTNEAFEIIWTDDSPSATAIPFVIERGAPHDTLYLDDLGQIGVGTNTPGVDLHIHDPDIDGLATLRFEETVGTAGFWDITASRGAFSIFNGETANFPMVIELGAPGDSFVINSNGNIGLGTSQPEEAVDVVADGAARFQLSSFSSTAADAAQYIQRRARGNQAAPAPVQSGDNIGLFSFRGMRPNGLFSGSKAAITVQATQNWQNSQNGTSIKFGTTQNGTSTLSTVMEITHDKKVKINGTDLNVPDYVFEGDYELMPLDELKTFIQQHKHLPDVASAEHVKREGMDLGGSQMALLRKIEELTLYTLRQQTEINELRELVNRLVANDQLAAVNCANSTKGSSI